jgi:glycosyltransferase involved in cell wall biosynthesis
VNLPLVAFVSDLNPLLPPRIRDNIGHWTEVAVRTFAISDFTTAELKRMKPNRSDRIYSIPLAAPEGVRGDGVVPPGNFYYPAAPNKHKGHLTLLEAARSLAVRGFRFQLTFTGAGMDAFAYPGEGNEVIQRMRLFLEENRKVLNGQVTVAGDAGASEVDRLFAGASCVVLPSSYEGFGLPLAEALAYGKRVICADIAPFREQIERHQCETLATFVPPGDATALAEAMAAHLSEDQPPALTAQALKERLNRWTWTDAAERCRMLLEELLHHE